MYYLRYLEVIQFGRKESDTTEWLNNNDKNLEANINEY